MNGKDIRKVLKENKNTFNFFSKKEGKMVKMCYEYIKLKKVYSIFNFPRRWTYPLWIVFNFYCDKLSDQNLIKIAEPKIPFDMKSTIDHILKEDYVS